MSKSRMEWKVGLFVLLGLVLAAALVIQFNKSAGPLTPTYHLRLQARDVSGVFPGSGVLMAGVRVGNVERIELNTSAGDVTMIANMLKKYEIKKDATFMIRQSGFLGDQFIGVFQGKTNTILVDGDVVQCDEPFDLGEIARSTGGLVKRVDSMVGQLSNAVARVDAALLSSDTLTNLAMTVANFRSVSERTMSTLKKVEDLIDTNSVTLTSSLTNVKHFSVELNNVTADLRGVIATNKEDLSASMANLKNATAKLDNVIDDVNRGKGTVGALLKNEQMATDLSQIVSNLSVLSSNINNKGLWGVFRKPKLPK